MSKTKRFFATFVVTLLCITAAFLFVFPSYAIQGSLFHLWYVWLGPNYFPVFVRIVAGYTLLFLGWLMFFEIAAERRGAQFRERRERRDALLETNKIVEVDARPQDKRRPSDLNS